MISTSAATSFGTLKTKGGGERNDITQAKTLIENLFANAVLADKGYDANNFIPTIEARNSTVVMFVKGESQSSPHHPTSIFTKIVT